LVSIRQKVLHWLSNCEPSRKHPVYRSFIFVYLI
jgi:hypothetical protein